jgi:magnesium-protoporphyrin IX monomethyl ester (oxidative) cyclase
MNLTLINPPLAYSKSQVSAGVVPSLGIAYLAAVALRDGHKVQVIDAVGEAPDEINDYRIGFDIRGLSFDEIAHKIPKNTDLIGISNLFTFTYPVVFDMAKTLKDKRDAPIVLGGAHPSATPVETLRSKNIDYVVISEGEQTLLDLLDVLDGKKKEKELDGFAWKEGKQIKVNPKTKFIQDLDSLPFPARHLLPMETYFKKKEAHGPTEERWTPLISSRGCPFECTFCTPRLWQRKWRFRSAKNVVDEIEECIEDFNIHDFYFDDENMTLEKKRVFQICDEIKRRKLDITWQTPNGIRASVTDRETLAKMKEAGCKHITVAPESGSNRVLNEIMKKHQTLDQVTNVVVAAHDLGIKTAAFLLIGLPGETEEDIRKTIDYSDKLARLGLDEISYSIFIPLPGSELYDKLKKEGKLNDSFDDLSSSMVLSLSNFGVDSKRKLSWSDVPFEKLQQYRKNAYIRFHMLRAIYHPLSTLRSFTNILSGKQETKTERVIQTFLKRYGKKQG